MGTFLHSQSCAANIPSQHEALICECFSVLCVLLQDFEGYAPECSAAVRGAFQRVQDLADHKGKQNTCYNLGYLLSRIHFSHTVFYFILNRV